MIFKVVKMDVFFNDIIDSLDAPKSNYVEVRIFRAWVETCQKKKLGPTGDPMCGAILVIKYGDLKWIDPDIYYTLCVTHINKI